MYSNWLVFVSVRIVLTIGKAKKYKMDNHLIKKEIVHAGLEYKSMESGAKVRNRFELYYYHNIAKKYW